MNKNSFHKVLSCFADIRPEETSSTVLMFFYFFLITSSAYIIKPIKISLFLEKLKFIDLPYAYLFTALLIGFFVSLNSRLLHVMKRHVYISISLSFFIANLLVFWLFFQKEWPWLSMIYWIWSEIFMVTSVTQFWILVNDIYTPRQAKRLIGFLVSGGLLGGIAGAQVATFLTKKVGTLNLLLICPFMLGICIVIVNLVQRLFPKEKKEKVKKLKEGEKAKTGYGKSFQLLKKNRHLVLLSGIMATAIVVTTLIDFQFNSVIQSHFIETDKRTSFLGVFFTGLLIFSFLLHTLSTTRILRNFGIRIALLITPLFLLVGSFAAFLVKPIGRLIYWAVPIKGVDKSLAHSLNQSVRELLYIPIPPDIKYKAKVFIDMFVNKFAKGIGAILILFVSSAFHFSARETETDFIVRHISFLVIILTVIWIILNLLITREYVNIVKRGLKIKWKDADRLIGEKIDIDRTKLVFDTLESKKRSSVLYAMNLFDLVKKDKMSPELKKIISHKSDEIRASSMDSLLELDGEVLIPEIDDSLEEESLDVQVKEIMSLNVYQELMNEHIYKVVSEEGKETDVAKMEAAKVMGMMEPSPSLIHNLSKLIRDESPEVVRYAVESAGKLKRREFVPFIIQHLSKPSTQQIANQALVEYGNKIIGTLKDYLGDSEENIRVRETLPDILAQIGTQRAADLLTMELKKEKKEVESEIVEAMYKIKSRNPKVNFQKKIIFAEIILKIRECYLIMTEIYDLMADKKKEFLAKDLENKLTRSIRHIFEMLSLVYPHEDMIKAYQNICTGTKKSIDYSIELLDNIIKREIMEVLLPLIDDIPFEDKVRKGKRVLKILEKNKFS